MTRRRTRAWMSWSSGKDSAFALHEARRSGALEVTGLMVTLDGAADRVAMHAVRRQLVDAQARALGLPVHYVPLPWPCPNAEYERLMAEAVAAARADEVEAMVFGDLFLADIRAYREQQLAGTGIEPVFPLWQRPTAALAREMVATGVRAVLTCVDPAQLDPSYAGRWLDAALLDDLPGEVDPCGENGEFHTFVVDGPGFASPVPVEVGEVVERNAFVVCDVLPAATGSTAGA